MLVLDPYPTQMYREKKTARQQEALSVEGLQLSFVYQLSHTDAKFGSHSPHVHDMSSTKSQTNQLTFQ